MKRRKEKQDLEGKFLPVLDAVLKPILKAKDGLLKKKKSKKSNTKNIK